MNVSLTGILEPIRKLLTKRHTFIFFTISCLLLAFAIYSLYDVLTLSSDKPQDVTSTISGFDKATIDKIKDLHNSNDTSPAPLEFPSTRSNPFVE